MNRMVDCFERRGRRKDPLHIKSRRGHLTQLLINKTGWLLQEERKTKGSTLYQVEKRSFDTIVDQHYWLIVARGREKVPLLYWAETRSINTIVDRNYQLIVVIGSRKESHCIELRRGHLTQLLIDRTGWLLQEEVERCPLHIKWRQGQLTQLLINITGQFAYKRKETGVHFLWHCKVVDWPICWLMLLVDCCKTKGNGVPFLSTIKFVDQHICWVTKVVASWRGNRKDFFFGICN